MSNTHLPLLGYGNRGHGGGRENNRLLLLFPLLLLRDCLSIFLAVFHFFILFHHNSPPPLTSVTPVRWSEMTGSLEPELSQSAGHYVVIGEKNTIKIYNTKNKPIIDKWDLFLSCNHCFYRRLCLQNGQDIHILGEFGTRLCVCIYIYICVLKNREN